ncbi:MAG TPA: HEAT repeat domain-containing protein, partial [Polyangia bacterium]|nr:HEAT repeat domain-containing protein [Polyangia bacterium]
AAAPALLERLRGDAYVPVRAAAARALAAVGDRAAVPALEQAARRDTEPMVAAAAREAAQTLKARRP